MSTLDVKPRKNLEGWEMLVGVRKVVDFQRKHSCNMGVQFVNFFQNR
jgi:hypothetical protein